MGEKNNGFQQGQSGNPAGRPSGVPNKSTIRAREAIAKLVDDNSERLQGWLDDIAATDGPLAAWKCVMDVVEYHIPKLQRTEHVGDGGGPVHTVTEININLIRAKPHDGA